MKRKKIVNTAVFLLVVLGILMIYFGGFHAPKVMIPPILTGLGFFIIAWAFKAAKKH